MRHVHLPASSELEPGEALVHLTLSTICGSDIHTITGQRTEPTPLVLGHEGVGVVEALGVEDDGSDLAAAHPGISVGDRVSWTIADSCGTCDFCDPRVYDLPQKCHSLFKYGHARVSSHADGLSGTYASHIVIKPGTLLVKIPASVPDAAVAPANCALATMVNACSHVPHGAHSVMVQGAGLLGLYGVLLLRDRGVEHVWVSDVDDDRLAQMATFGARTLNTVKVSTDDADALVRADAGPDGLDAVLEVCGAPDVVPFGVRMLRNGGTMVLCGLVHPNSSLASVTGEMVIRKCLSVHGVHNYAPKHLVEGIGFLERVASRDASDAGVTMDDLTALVSPPYALSDFDAALDEALSRRWMRVAVDPSRGAP